MDFCPLCIKNGVKRRVVAFQINLEEAVWACEGQECIWPFGFRELMVFKRIALNNELEELKDKSLTKEDIPLSMELSLYTPPMTPLEQSSESAVSHSTVDNLGEILHKNESVNWRRSFNTLPSLELREVKSNNSIEENKNVTIGTNTCISTCRTQPGIMDIQKSTTDITVTCQDAGEHFDNQTIEGHKHVSVNIIPVIDNAKDFKVPSDDVLCKKFSLDVQSEAELETNCNAEILSKTINSEVDVDNMNNLSIVNNSILDISDTDMNIDMILNNLTKEDCITQDINDDWLDLLIA